MLLLGSSGVADGISLAIAETGIWDGTCERRSLSPEGPTLRMTEGVEVEGSFDGEAVGSDSRPAQSSGLGCVTPT